METAYKTKNSKEIRSNFLLLITAVIWGGGFVAQRLGMQELGPYIFNGFRFLVGALTLVPVIIIRKKRIPEHESELKKTSLLEAQRDYSCFLEPLFNSLAWYIPRLEKQDS